MARKYSPEEKEAALAIYVESGPAEASRRTGIPKGTLASWGNRTGTQTLAPQKAKAAVEAMQAYIALRRSELKQLLIEKAIDLVGRMDEEHIDFKAAGPLGPMEVTFPKAPAAACQHYATSVGILIDKFRLESGEATSREEHLPKVQTIIVTVPEESSDGTLDGQ